MDKEKDIKVEIDSRTIKAIATMCELSGLDVPEVINCEFIEKASSRVKDLIIQLKKQIESIKEQGSEDSKKVEEQKTAIEDLKRQRDELKNKLQELKDEVKSSNTEKESKPKKAKKDDDTEETTRDSRTPGEIGNILIIANLGLIMHQLKVLFKKFGVQVTSVKSYTEAIPQLKEKEFDCILFDMQTVNDNDLMLVEALRKATEICHTDTVIAILTLPIKDKKSFKKLKSKGADIIIEKVESWHMNILEELKITNK